MNRQQYRTNVYMKNYYVLKLLSTNELYYFTSAKDIMNLLEEKSIPANKCEFKKLLNVKSLSDAQNYLETHQTKNLSYNELKDDLIIKPS